MQSDLGVISVSNDKGCLPLSGMGEGDTCTREIYALFGGQIEEKQSTLSVSVFSQLPSTPKNSYAKVVYFGVAYPDPFITAK